MSDQERAPPTPPGVSESADSAPTASTGEPSEDSALPRSFGEAFGELLRDRFVQAILAAGLLLGALEMGFFG